MATTPNLVGTRLRELVLSITEDNGYNTTFDANNVVLNDEEIEAGLRGDEYLENYPRCVITLEYEDYDYHPTSRVHKRSFWLVGVSLIHSENESVGLAERTYAAVEDVEKLFFNNHQPGAGINSVRLVQSFIDAGLTADDQSIAMFRVQVDYIANTR